MAYWCNCLVTNKTAGNRLAKIVDPDVGGDRTFDYATPLYQQGTTFQHPGQNSPLPPVASTSPIAWIVGVRMTEGGKAYVDEFNSAGPYPRMEAAGIPAATVNALKNNGVVDIVLYSIESAVDPLTYAESKGYVVYRPVVVPPT